MAPLEEGARGKELLIAAAGDEIVGLGLTGQMHGAVFLDQDDRVIRPAVLWNDGRTAAECAEITALVGEDRLLEYRRESGTHRLPGAQAALAARARAGSLRGAWRACCCRRTISATG